MRNSTVIFSLLFCLAFTCAKPDPVIPAPAPTVWSSEELIGEWRYEEFVIREDSTHESIYSGRVEFLGDSTLIAPDQFMFCGYLFTTNPKTWQVNWRGELKVATGWVQSSSVVTRTLDFQLMRGDGDIIRINSNSWPERDLACGRRLHYLTLSR